MMQWIIRLMLRYRSDTDQWFILRLTELIVQLESVRDAIDGYRYPGKLIRYNEAITLLQQALNYMQDATLIHKVADE
jgi:hypothetical protein